MLKQSNFLSCQVESYTYSTAFTRTSGDSLGLILYTRTGFESQFTINGGEKKRLVIFTSNKTLLNPCKI